MKANEFIKKFGWDGAISFTDWYGGNTTFKFLKVKEKTISVHSGDQPYDFHINDLKRLVDSHELVEKLGGLISSKKYLKFLQSSVDMGLYHGLDDVDYKTEIPLIKQAIADVESCCA